MEGDLSTDHSYWPPPSHLSWINNILCHSFLVLFKVKPALIDLLFGAVRWYRAGDARSGVGQNEEGKEAHAGEIPGGGQRGSSFSHLYISKTLGTVRLQPTQISQYQISAQDANDSPMTPGDANEVQTCQRCRWITTGVYQQEESQSLQCFSRLNEKENCQHWWNFEYGFGRMRD